MCVRMEALQGTRVPLPKLLEPEVPRDPRKGSGREMRQSCDRQSPQITMPPNWCSDGMTGLIPMKISAHSSQARSTQKRDKDLQKTFNRNRALNAEKVERPAVATTSARAVEGLKGEIK